MNDTIVAISTALGVGAINIIRISGFDSVKMVNKIFKGKDLENVSTHTINYGYINYKEKIIDEVLVSVMLAPKTFTKENIVEINCHGGISATNKILEILQIEGCRLAEPGEFTKRAFLNGRIDLLEAEGVMDLIKAKTDTAREFAINEINGKSSNLIKDLRNQIIKILANLEVNIDYPEYDDIENITLERIFEETKKFKQKIINIINTNKESEILKEGIKTIIIGQPNVGKSSILNKLINEEKAIVTDIAGTTRDIVEGKIIIDGVIFNIYDTAGIRKTENIIEKIGVNKSIDLLEKSELVLYVINNNEQIDEEYVNILKKIKGKNYIIIVNKIDLDQKIDYSILDKSKVVYMSVKSNKGIEELKNKIKELFNLDELKNKDMEYFYNSRSIAILEKSLKIIEDIEKGIENKVPIDMIEIDIKNLWSLLGEIIGETYNNKLIDQLFSQFCLGK